MGQVGRGREDRKGRRRTEDRRGGGSKDGSDSHGQEKLQVVEGLIAGECVSTVIDLPNLAV